MPKAISIHIRSRNRSLTYLDSLIIFHQCSLPSSKRKHRILCSTRLQSRHVAAAALISEEMIILIVTIQLFQMTIRTLSKRFKYEIITYHPSNIFKSFFDMPLHSCLMYIFPHISTKASASISNRGHVEIEDLHGSSITCWVGWLLILVSSL